MLTWAEFEASYAEARQQAIDNKTCFCVCGCNRPVEDLGFLGQPVSCDECRATKGHRLTPPAAEGYALLEAGQDRADAIAYVLSVGEASSPATRRIYERIQAGKPITEVQVTRALTAKAQDHTAAIKTLAKVQRLPVPEPVYISPEIKAGDYAVLAEGKLVHIAIERPVEGSLSGFTVVRHFVGEGVEVVGFQYPQPSRQVGDYRQTYRGFLPVLVAALVSNPEEARTRYEEAV